MRSRSRILRDRLRARVIVTVKGGESFKGVLFDFDGRALVLREALAMGVGQRQSDIPIDGEMVILWDEVTFVQRP